MPDAPAGIILVIRTHSNELALRAARGAAAGGFDAIEITLTVPSATEIIRTIRDEYDVAVGVGTVLSPHQLHEPVKAGASFAVSPSTDSNVINAAAHYGIAVIPGALTPTEVVAAHRLGASAVKLFPAGSVGGPSYLRELRGPLPHIPFVISGGVTDTSARDYFAAGAHAVCVGRSVFSSELLEAGSADGIANQARRFVEQVAAPISV